MSAVVALVFAFPVMIPVPWGDVHPHLLFDVLSYALGFVLYRVLRKRAAASGLRSNPGVTSVAGLWLLAGAVFGAAVGAKLLAWAEHPHVYFDAMRAGHCTPGSAAKRSSAASSAAGPASNSPSGTSA